MAHRRLLVDRVLVVAWRAPVEEDVRAIGSDLAAGHKSLKTPLLYLSVIGKDAIPQGKMRETMVDFYRTLIVHAESMHLVIEGSEFEQSIKRSVVASAMLQVDMRGRIFVESTLERLQQISPAAVRSELARAIQFADERHLFDFARADNPEEEPQ
jgi:hypothetical protein